MKTQDLIDRYVYAIVRHLPRKQAADIDQELHGLIEDMLAERCGERPIEEKDVLVVLTELGTPQEMAVQYDPDKNNSLISQPYYNQYKLVLKWVLLAILLGLTVSSIVGAVFSTLEGNFSLADAGFLLVKWLLSLIAACLCVTGAFTILYALLERKGISLLDSLGIGDNLKDLPPVPEKKEKISKGDAICSIVFSVIFVILFLLTPQVISAVFIDGDTKEVLPVLNISALRHLWYVILGIGLCGVAEGVFRLMEGRYTLRLAAANGICNGISILLGIVLIMNKHLINPILMERAANRFTGEEAWLGTFFAPNFFRFFLLLIILGCVTDFGVTLFRAIRYRQTEA